MKILFLDIDYVLNSHKFEIQRSIKGEPYEPYFSDIDPRCTNLLNHILKKEKDLKIVISSSWRDSLTLKEFQDLFSRFNVSKDKIIGTTSSEVDKPESIEIWVRENNPKKFVILDDDFLFDKSHKLYNNFYRVSTKSLQEEDIPQIIEILNK